MICVSVFDDDQESLNWTSILKICTSEICTDTNLKSTHLKSAHLHINFPIFAKIYALYEPHPTFGNFAN